MWLPFSSLPFKILLRTKRQILKKRKKKNEGARNYNNSARAVLVLCAAPYIERLSSPVAARILVFVLGFVSRISREGGECLKASEKATKSMQKGWTPWRTPKRLLASSSPLWMRWTTLPVRFSPVHRVRTSFFLNPSCLLLPPPSLGFVCLSKRSHFEPPVASIFSFSFTSLS